jgi:hypothetical protein
MPDFTALDKAMLVTVLSAAATFMIVLVAGLMLLKNKNRIRIKRQRRRGGKAWRNARQFNHRQSWRTFRKTRILLRNVPRKALILLLLFAAMGIMRYTTPDSIRDAGSHKSGTTTYHYKRYEGGRRIHNNDNRQSYDTASQKNKRNTESRTLFCNSPYIIDGDTFDCIGTRIRLMGIDAPEMPDHCRPGRRCTKGDPLAAKEYLQSLATGRVTCRVTEIDHYGRSIARCHAGEVDLSCAMIASGHAVRRYSNISCP